MSRSRTTWKPGESGNPSGRPRVVHEVVQLAREHTTEAIQTLAKIMRDPKEHSAARVAAANSLLDRGYGRPAQSLDIGIQKQNFEGMSDQELIAIAGGTDDTPTAH